MCWWFFSFYKQKKKTESNEKSQKTIKKTEFQINFKIL